MTRKDGIRFRLVRAFSSQNRVPLVLFAITLMVMVALEVDLRRQDERFEQERLVYRSLQFEPIAPVGTVSSAPAEFSWQPVTEAAAYQLSLMEVDSTEIWSVGTRDTTAPIPVQVRQKMTAGTGFLWMVVARNSAGEKIAEMGLQKLYIRPAF